MISHFKLEEESEEGKIDFNKEEIKEKKSLYTILYDFAENTTAHGFSQIVQANHFWSELFCVTALMICHVIILVHVQPLINLYYMKPVGTSESVEFERAPNFHLKNCSSEKYWEKIWHRRYGSCFVFNNDKMQDGMNRKVERISQAGPFESLKLLLNVRKDQYVRSLTDSAGIKLYIGTQGSFYHMLDKGQGRI